MKKLNFLIKNYLTGWQFANSCLLVLLSLTAAAQNRSYKSATLELQPINPNLLVHVSYINTDSWGKVPCNGLVYISKDSAFIFDTPTNDTSSRELIRILQKKWKLTIKGVVVTHFHTDCLGGLTAFHQAGIPSFSNEKTIGFAKQAGFPLPQQGFSEELVTHLNGQPIIHRFFGEGHTKDNIVSYIPEYKALFGGCLLKEKGAGFGFVGDANITAWSATVNAVKKTYPNLQHVIPGHGKIGDAGLLDYTASLFKVVDAKSGAYTPQASNEALYQQIRQLDSAFFDAYNRRDLEATMAFFSADLEFYHDQGGKADLEQTRTGMKRFFDNNAENGFRRDPIEGSFEIYAIPGYGAIQMNLHRFCHIENKTLDCGIFKNVLFWKKEGTSWKIARVMSLGH